MYMLLIDEIIVNAADKELPFKRLDMVFPW